MELPHNAFYDLILDDEQAAFVAAIKNPQNDIIFCNSVAGSGKTTIAMGTANILYHDKRNGYKGIMYIVSPYAEKRQGYLPGDTAQKSAVYFGGAMKAIKKLGMNPYTDICDASGERKKYGDAFIELMTHTYMRGDDEENKIVIIDEAQNFTVSELKMVLTRLHDNDKIIVIGHSGQIDIDGDSGFERYINHFKNKERCAVCTLTKNHRGWVSNHADLMEE